MKNRPGFLAGLFVLVLVASLPVAFLWVTQFGAVGLGALLAFGAYFLLFHVFLPYWTYADARSRRFDSGAATRWAAAVFFLPLLGIAAYLLVRTVRAQSAESGGA